MRRIREKLRPVFQGRKIRREERIKELIKNLGHEKVGEKAMRKLVRYGKYSITPLGEILRSKKETDIKKEAAIRALKEIGGKEVFPHLGRVLIEEGEKASIKKAAVRALGEIGDKEPFKAGMYISNALNDKKRDVREEADRALKEIALKVTYGRLYKKIIKKKTKN